MYRCEVCQNVSRPGQCLLRYTLYRQVPAKKVCQKIKTEYGYREQIVAVPSHTEIRREVALCETCYNGIEIGTPFQEVVSERYVSPTQEIQSPPSPSRSEGKPIQVKEGNVPSSPGRNWINSLNGTPRPTPRSKIGSN